MQLGVPAHLGQNVVSSQPLAGGARNLAGLPVEGSESSDHVRYVYLLRTRCTPGYALGNVATSRVQ